MADKLTVKIELENTGTLEASAELNALENSEKVPFFIAKLTEAVLARYAEAMANGETQVHETYSSAEGEK